MDGTTWEPQIEHFADDYRVVTLDVRGHGNTGVTEPDQYSIDLFTDDLEALLATRDRTANPLWALAGVDGRPGVSGSPFRRRGGRDSGRGSAIDAPVELPSGVKSFWSPMPALATSLSVGVGGDLPFDAVFDTGDDRRTVAVG